MIKWIGLSLGVLVGVSHIAMIGMIATNKEEKGLPVVTIPEGDYGSFRADVTKDGYKTVSYTHLRAHETPEQLVCRLLLEKKKNGYLQS